MVPRCGKGPSGENSNPKALMVGQGWDSQRIPEKVPESSGKESGKR